MGVPGRDRLQKIGQTSGCTPKIQSSCAVKAIGPIVVCCLELRFDAASAPGEPCGPGSSTLGEGGGGVLKNSSKSSYVICERSLN